VVGAVRGVLLRAAAELLAKAQKPVIIAGGGVVSSQAQAELVALAEKLQVPVATSLTAKGAISDLHPLSVGVCGTYSRACANKVVSEADLVFFVGNHAGGQLTTNYRIPAAGTAVIQLDLDPEQLGRNYSNTVSLHGDAKATLAAMAEAGQGKTPEAAKAWTARVRDLVTEWRANAEKMRQSDAIPMRPERICKEITEALPADGVLVSDTGHAGMWTGQMVDITRPGDSRGDGNVVNLTVQGDRISKDQMREMFDAINSHGKLAAIMGDELKLADGVKLTAKLPLPAYVRLLRHGEEVAKSEGRAEFAFDVKERGAYRLEAWLTLDGELRPWIFSNPIYVR
jgi:hypothetical protein